MKAHKIENLLWGSFFAVGMLLLVIGIGICIYVFDYENTAETTGVISDITSHRDSDGDTSHRTFVQYEVDGVPYESSLNAYSSSYYAGKEIEIYYHIDDPGKIGVKSLDLLFLMFPGFGIVFGSIGGIGLLVRRRKKNLEKRLRASGTCIQARYTETVINTSYRVNHRHPYNIICEWNNPADGKKYIFRSKNIWVNPESTIAERGLITFPVYIDMAHKRKYVIDVDGLTDNIVDLR